MDRIEALVEVAHRRLKLRRLLVAVERNPNLLEEIDMGENRLPLAIPKPVELAGMRSRLIRAQGQQKDLAQIGKDYDAVMDGIDEAKAALKGHVSDLKIYEGALRTTIEGMLERSNGGDPLDGGKTNGQSGQGSTGQGQQQAPTTEKQTITEGDVGNVATVVAPEKVDVHGVSQG
jgi:hypothetical protein